MRCLLIAALLAALNSTAVFAQDEMPIEPGMPYELAREALLNHGWEGIPGTGDLRCSGRADICSDWPEVVQCAGTGVAPCLFSFNRSGAILNVATVGEEPIAVSSWEMQPNKLAASSLPLGPSGAPQTEPFLLTDEYRADYEAAVIGLAVSSILATAPAMAGTCYQNDDDPSWRITINDPGSDPEWVWEQGDEKVEIWTSSAGTGVAVRVASDADGNTSSYMFYKGALIVDMAVYEPGCD